MTRIETVRIIALELLRYLSVLEVTSWDDYCLGVNLAKRQYAIINNSDGGTGE
jgi:hypothetical protein